MMPQIIQFFVQFLEGDVAGVARNSYMNRVDLVAEACAQIVTRASMALCTDHA